MTPATEAAIRAATRLHIERRLTGLSRELVKETGR